MSIIEELMNFLDQSPTNFHAQAQARAHLEDAGFQELKKSEAWELKEGGAYYVSNQEGALLAFRLGSLKEEDFHFRLVASHGDSPTFKIKPSSEMKDKEGYVRLNTEVYGGPILSTWFDRPLSIAGQVWVKEGEGMASHLVKFDRDLLTIPSLAIHMNREVNEGYKFNPQKDTLPLLAMGQEGEEGFLEGLLAQELGVDQEDILDFDLFLYNRDKASRLGLRGDFISSGRLDNLSMGFLSLKALIDSPAGPGTCGVILYDHEEVGSESRVGAGGPFIRDSLERIASFAQGQAAFYRGMDRSFMISADLTHGLHPNYRDKADPTNAPVLNGGPAIKQAASKSYASDAYSASFFRLLCQEAGVPVQSFSNRSDIRGGSTIGPISLGQLDIAMVDIGNPTLAMHSARELVGAQDQEALYKVFLHFYGRKTIG
ncbi:MAG: M18 family aminopeptidase [Tissierellia bacterium]|nr:M18 family aminopeptidase [Tissierellia bacterium]